MFEKVIGQNPGNSSSDGRTSYCNRSGVVESVGREHLTFSKVENGVTKSCQHFRRKITEKTQFWPESFHFFEQGRLLLPRVDIGVTEFLVASPLPVLSPMLGAGCLASGNVQYCTQDLLLHQHC